MPFGAYSHSVEASGALRWLTLSGQVGVTPDGTLANGFQGQAEQTFRNLIAILQSEGYGLGDVVKINTFLTRSSDVAAYRGVRDKMLQGKKPASTLLVVDALANPDWLIEVEAVAAKADE
ncbi:MAG: RidA family protein [Pseudomonadota bacterium]